MAGPDPRAAPQSPQESLRARSAITAVAGGVSLALGLASNHSLLGGLDGYPWGLRAADVACGTIGYAALWWRRRWPLAFAGYILDLGAPDIDVVGAAADGAAAITATAELVPDVVLMDIRMPGTDGVTATAAITAATAARVVALTTFDADELVRQAINAGAVGYLVKDTLLVPGWR